MQKVLVPPPAAKSDEILSASGGMFYPREAPGMDVYVKEGDHFEAGDVLYIVEVMKMFNKEDFVIISSSTMIVFL